MSKKYFQVFTLIILWALSGCSPSDCGCSSSPHADVLFSFVDKEGNDRLDPNYGSPLGESNLDIYYLKDDEKEKVFDGSLRYPKNFKIYHSESEGKFIMMLWPSNHVEEGGNTTTFIEFPDGTIDTVTMEPINEDANSAERLWYDEELVWETDSGDTMPIEITKPVARN